VERGEIPKRASAALDLVGLGALDARYPRELSGGQQQRVALARVLALNPHLLLLDEPLSNLDAKLRVQMRQEIRRLQKEVGITTLFVTHDQEEALTMADRIVVMNQGCIEQVGAPLEIYDRPQTRFVADFIGQSNFIEGRLATENGASCFIATSGLRFRIAADDAREGQGVLAVRPEKVIVSPVGEPGAHPGAVRHLSRLGAVLLYGVALDGGDIMIVQEQRRPGLDEYEIGARVALRWRPEDGQFLPGAPQTES
jgi:ABC-type Fe3+/spermidine/putrescine transport system ATPase subunit